ERLGVEIVREDAGALRNQLEDDRPADAPSRPGDERHPAVEPARVHGVTSAHSSIASIMMPLVSRGWISHRPCAAPGSGGRSMTGRPPPLAATSSVTRARW